MTNQPAHTDQKAEGLRLSGLGKVLLVMLGLVFFVPLLLVALGVIVLVLVTGGALFIALIAGFLGIMFALLAMVVSMLGGTLSFPVVWPWLS
jgi:hypothetical protein